MAGSDAIHRALQWQRLQEEVRPTAAWAPQTSMTNQEPQRWDEYRAGEPPQESSLSNDAIGGIGAGVQGAGKALQGIMEAFAKAQALQNNKMNAEADDATFREAAGRRLSTQRQDFDAENRQRALASLLRLMSQQQGLRNNSTALQQNATDTATDSAVASRRKR